MRATERSVHSDDVLLLTLHEMETLVNVVSGSRTPPGQLSRVSIQSGVKSLRSRGLLDPMGNVPPAIGAMIRVALEPSATVIATRQTTDSLTARRLSLTPDLGTEQWFVTPSIQAFAPFEPADLIDRIADLSQIEPGREQAPGKSFPLSVAELRRCEAELATGDEKAALATLRKAGADKKAATGFVQALQGRKAAASVTVLHQTDANRMEGGSVTWIDGGEAGLWICDTPNPIEIPFEDTWNLTIRPSGGADLLEEISGYLPDHPETTDPA